jgi:hypothetical protein
MKSRNGLPVRQGSAFRDNATLHLYHSGAGGKARLVASAVGCGFRWLRDFVNRTSACAANRLDPFHRARLRARRASVTGRSIFKIGYGWPFDESPYLVIFRKMMMNTATAKTTAVAGATIRADSVASPLNAALQTHTPPTNPAAAAGTAEAQATKAATMISLAVDLMGSDILVQFEASRADDC